ncbi:hypothetical protein Peur_020927 [Populus x canadensis]
MGRYCGRFVSGSYCEECSCADCHNNVENEGVRREATECVNCKNLEGSEMGMDVLYMGKSWQDQSLHSAGKSCFI